MLSLDAVVVYELEGILLLCLTIPTSRVHLLEGRAHRVIGCLVRLENDRLSAHACHVGCPGIRRTRQLASTWMLYQIPALLAVPLSRSRCGGSDGCGSE
jgi:hypothetical protein